MSPAGGPTIFSRREIVGTAIGLSAAAQAAPMGGSVAMAAVAPASDGELSLRFRTCIANAGIPGAAAAFIRPGEQPRLLSTGHASLPFQVPVTPATLFHAGSVGKHVTAVAALRLVDSGRLDLSGAIGRYLSVVPKAWRQVPVATILSHTSGIPDYGGGISWDRPFGRAEFFADAGERPLEFEPGTAWRYCNAAYTLLGYLLEDVTGTSYAALIADLFARAGLRDSRVDDAEAVIPLRAEPYENRGGAWRHATPMSSSISSVAAGGILMSARDVPAWKAALSGGDLLPASARTAMATPFRFKTGRLSSYNMGWHIDAMPGNGVFLWHSGSVSGFRCFHFESRATGVSMMMFCNAETDADQAIALELLELFEPNSTPLALRPLIDRAPALTEAARAIVTRARAWDLALFAPELRLVIERLGDDAIDYFGENAPPVVAFDLVQQDEIEGGVRRRYRAMVGTAVRHVTVGYARDKSIYEISLL